jgi:hypothetical protein
VMQAREVAMCPVAVVYDGRTMTRETVGGRRSSLQVRQLRAQRRFLTEGTLGNSLR